MADINKFTTKEVLNKVLLDSSGDAVVGFSHTTQEALNAVLDTSNNRLNISIAGGTISGDVTISGDLTVSGDNVLNVSETIQGKLNVVEGAGTLPTLATGDLIIAQNNDTTSDIAAIYAIAGNAGSSHYVFGDADSKNPGRVSYYHSDNYMSFHTNAGERMRIDSSGKVAIGTSTIPSTHTDIAHLSIGADASIIGTKASGTSSNTTFAHNAYFDSSDSRWEYIGSSSNEASALQLLDGKIVAKVAAAGTANNAITWIDAMTITSAGDILIPANSELQEAAQGDAGNRIKLKNSSDGNMEFKLESSSYDYVFPDGKFGIGTSSPTSTTVLEVNGQSGATTEVLRLVHGTYGTLEVAHGSPAYGSGKLAVHSSGDLAIGGAGSTINFGMGSTVIAVFDTNSSISLSNNDNNTANTVFGKTAFNESGDVGADYNVAIGELAMGTGTLSNATYNVAVGYSALTDVTSGDYNVAIGAIAGANLVGGSDNVAIGKNALKDAVSITKIVAIGTQALEDINDDANDGSVAIGYLAGSKKAGSGTQYTKASVHIGYSSGAAQTSGANNTSVGHATMGGNVSGTALTGSDNTVMGYSAGYAMEGASNGNTLYGSNSGLALTTGGDNVAIGSQALTALTEGSNNIAIGSASLDAVTTTSSSIAIGHNALTALTSGVYNVAIGHNAAAELEDNHANTVIGYQAMYRSGATTYHNVYIGNLAGDGDWTGACHSNTAVGSSVMRGAMTITAVNNVAMGRDALAALTSGHSNVAIGKSAGASIVDATYNTAVGHNAGDATVDGGRNVSLGAFSHGNADTGDKNIAIGYQSGYVMTGSNNITIGNQCGDSITSGNHNTLIGDEADADAATDSYQVKIGSYGIKKFKTARVTLSSFSSGNNSSGNIYSNGALFTIPAYSFVKRVVVKIVTLSSNADALLAIGSSATLDSALGASISSASYYVRHSSLATGYTSRSQASTGADVAINVGDNANANSVVGMTFIGATDDNNAGGWLSAEHAFYVVHAGSNTNSDPSTDPVIDVLVEYY